MIRPFWTCGPVLLLAGALLVPASGTGAAGDAARGDPARGQALYRQKCAVCHGPSGKGDGPAEFVLFPKPRDLTSGKFKIRSTPTLPTDEDLFRVVSQGIPGTAMPGWAGLTPAERWDLVAYVKSLSPGFARQPPAAPVRIPVPPAPSPALLALGQRLYAEAECLACHGPAGKGDGEAAPTLRDEWGFPSVPYDFTIPGRMKGGSTVRDVYRTLRNGLGGTPMPSYADSLGKRELWALAYYVLSLGGRPVAPPLPDAGTITVRRVTGEVPTDPQAPAWARVGLQAVRLRTLWMRPAQVDQVRVAALHNGREIAFLLEWDDPLRDEAALGTEQFRDAAAIQFPLEPPGPAGAGSPEPSYAMGEARGPVNIWHWKADWQLDLARYRDVEDRFPAVAVDDVPFVRGASGGDPGAIRAPADRHDPLFLAARAVGNPMARPRRSPVENLVAAGIGTLTSQPPEAQGVLGVGRWAAGRWRVLMRRALRTGHPGDVQFDPGQVTTVAFAVWDGARGDRDGQKAVSVWQRLRLEAR
jgi:mono/diheme cytochrome c family protein